MIRNSKGIPHSFVNFLAKNPASRNIRETKAKNRTAFNFPEKIAKQIEIHNNKRLIVIPVLIRILLSCRRDFRQIIDASQIRYRHRRAMNEPTGAKPAFNLAGKFDK